jgi:hypothetical protein
MDAYQQLEISLENRRKRLLRRIIEKREKFPLADRL